MTESSVKKYLNITYGCQMNENDSERLSGQLRTLGYETTESLDEADVVIINTCCVRESAEKKIYGKIGELKRYKTLNPNLLVIVAGCMAQKDREKLFKKAPHIDVVLGTYNTHTLIEVVREWQENREPILAVWEQAEQMTADVPSVRKSSTVAWVPIMYGCNNFCTYCIVPYVRGRERSRSKDEIVEEIRQLGRDGFKEITLLGQNVNSYGKDLGVGNSFAELLTAVDEVEEIERIRYMTSHPRDMNEEVVKVIANSRRICRQFHLPVQAGSNDVLKRMNRGYSREDYLELVSIIRRYMPDATLSTDVIVGFPGETDEDFSETMRLFREVEFDAAYTFIFSCRSGTPAATMPEQVPLALKKARLQQLMDLQNEISLKRNRLLEGKTVAVMVEGESKNDASRLVGRTDGNKLVLWKRDGSEVIGHCIDIEIEKAQTWLLKGRVKR
jgi:tRNA-2-methylthio-N6-dimethylallyladenosine synthase